MTVRGATGTCVTDFHGSWHSHYTCSLLLGQAKVDSYGMTERDSRWPSLPVGQHFKVAMGVHCHKSVPILTWPRMLPSHKTPITNQALSYHLQITPDNAVKSEATYLGHHPCVNFLSGIIHRSPYHRHLLLFHVFMCVNILFIWRYTLFFQFQSNVMCMVGNLNLCK